MNKYGYSLLLFFVFTLLGHQCCCLQPHHHKHNYFNVVDFGAVGDGITDDTQAFKDAWKATCEAAATSTTMHTPSGSTFLLKPLVFHGPCNSQSINVMIDGTIIAPRNHLEWNCNGKTCHQWIVFDNLHGLSVTGSGTVDGRGIEWWHFFCDYNPNQRNTHNKKGCHTYKPTGLVISHSTNVRISGLSFRDSPQKHIAFERSSWVRVRNLTITAPWDSPNTDGIHIQNSQNIFIYHTHIGTGDDCVSIGGGSSDIHITGMSCGPGHGISVGSLGKNGKIETVENVYVRNLQLQGTSNGVRIKTWQGGRGYARNIVFEHITCVGISRPIIIDQYYCDHQQCQNQKSAVQVSNVTYSHIHGTSNTRTAVKFACSHSKPCTDIFMNSIDLQSTQDRSKTRSLCSNVRGTSVEVFPAVPCFDLIV